MNKPFTPTQASLFLRCLLAEITKLQVNHQIEFIQLTEKHTFVRQKK